jgi:uncharacterized protein with HEPN domain
MNDALLQSALLWRLQTMAESAVQLSDELKARHPGVDWRGIRGFRNIVVPGYVDVLDLELTWTFIVREVDSLERVAVTGPGDKRFQVT